MDFKNLLSLTDATKLIPSRPSFSTLWRWCTQGIKTPSGAKVRLRYIIVGRTKHTTSEWLYDFFNNCTLEDFKQFNGQRTFSRVREKRQKHTVTNRDESQKKAYEVLKQRGINF